MREGAQVRPPEGVNPARLLAKAAVLLLVFNALFAWADPLPALGRLSLYNGPFPGRLRLPFGENSERSYNLSILLPQAMLASHELSAGPKPGDEFRLLLLGDSSVWGFLLGPEQTLSASINKLNLRTPDGRRVRAYNLGYPTLSLTKDLLILDLARARDPDLVLWFVTLESALQERQLDAPLLQHNPQAARRLIAAYGLPLDPQDPRLVDRELWDRTLFGARRELADWYRLQLYGALWAATGVDHDLAQQGRAPLDDLSADTDYAGRPLGQLGPQDLALQSLAAGRKMLGDTPLLVINEPIFRARGANSQLRYNQNYPRWAYDAYRDLLARQAQSLDAGFLDLWDAVPPEHFTDGVIHYDAQGVAVVVERLRPALQQALGR